MTMRIRLRAKCLLHGRIYQRGEIVTLPEGVKGPHRTVSAYQNADEIALTNSPINANRVIGKLEDAPLFDVLDDLPERHSDEQKAAADQAAELREKNVGKRTTP